MGTNLKREIVDDLGSLSEAQLKRLLRSVRGMKQHGTDGPGSGRNAGTHARQARPSAMGKYAHVGGSSEDFAREKEAEIAREDRKGP